MRTSDSEGPYLRKSIWPITPFLRGISRYNELFHLTEKTVSVFTIKQNVV